MHSFELHRPQTLQDAVARLRQGGVPLAGGQTLIATLRQRLAAPEHLVDLREVAEVRAGVRIEANRVICGAMTSHAEVWEALRGPCPSLSELAGQIGDLQVRNQGTLGGSLANNDPSADYPAALLALEATVRTNKNTWPAETFFKGLFETALEEDEIICEVEFPLPKRAKYIKFRQPASGFALVGVYVAQGQDDSCRVAVTGAGQSGVFRCKPIEAFLTEHGLPLSKLRREELAQMALEQDGLLADMHATPAYRAALIAVLASRAAGSLVPA